MTSLCTGHILSWFKLTHILIQCLLLIVFLLFALTLTGKTLTIAPRNKEVPHDKLLKLSRIFQTYHLFTVNSLKNGTYSGETCLYIFSFANNTVRHFFPFFASNRRSSKWSVKKIVFRQISLISHVSITVTNVKTKTTTTTTKMTSVCLVQQVLGTRNILIPIRALVTRPCEQI